MKSLALVSYLAELTGTRFASVSQKFFVRYHGKSICDRHFGNVARARYYYSEDIRETGDLRKALRNLSNEVFLEIPDEPLGRKCDKLNWKGIGQVDAVEDIRVEREEIKLSTVNLSVGEGLLELQETRSSRVITKKLTQERKPKT